MIIVNWYLLPFTFLINYAIIHLRKKATAISSHIPYSLITVLSSIWYSVVSYGLGYFYYLKLIKRKVLLSFLVVK